MSAGAAAVDTGTAERLLAALQYSDSFFPAGGIAFSWGLETLRADGLAKGANEIRAVVLAQLSMRWASCDRAVLQAAYAADGDDDALAAADHACEAMSLAREWRAASRRLGVAQLSVHASLGEDAAARYLARHRAGQVPAHLPVVQGLMARTWGFELATAEAMSAYAVAVSIAGAGLRMGLCGHLDAQRVLRDARVEVARLLANPAPSIDEAWTGGPMLELAVMRHETGTSRLFAN
jgi:urease accessory protein